MSSDLLLVVDDNKPSREVLARRLQREGYDVITAENGTTALEKLANHPVTLVLLDLDMPDLSGLQVVDRARNQFSLSELPILMVSATTDSPQMAHAIDRGANDFLTKPIQFEILLAKIRQFLRIRQKTPVTVSAPEHTSSGGLLLVAGEPTMVAHYKLLEKLGKGGAGHVYRALDTRLLREVALKVMAGEAGGSLAHERFLAEGRAVARIDHPGVVRIHEMGLTPCRFIAMEMIHGSTLIEYVENGVTVPQACDLVLQLLEALRAVHGKGVIHRDLKPANIMVSEEGRIKVTDFGLAHTGELDPAHLPTDDGMCGTPLYMSPEHISDKFGPIDEKSDLFAVAAILYELLTGYPPFMAQSVEELLKTITTTTPDPPRNLRPEVPDALQKVCLKGLSKRKEDRWPTAEAFAKALRESV